MLKIAGRLLRRVDHGVSYTFEELPRIVRTTRWNGELSDALQRHGIALLEKASLSGGAVEAFFAKKASVPAPFVYSPNSAESVGERYRRLMESPTGMPGTTPDEV